MLDAKQEIKEDVAIVRLKGKITIGEGDVYLRGMVKDLIDQGYKKILLDMKKVTTMDSAGMGELVAAFTTVKNRGGELKLLHLPTRILTLLEMTQLITIFETYEKEEEAFESFRP